MKENVASPEAPATSSNNNRAAFVIAGPAELRGEENVAGDAMSRAVKRKAVEEAGFGDASNTLICELLVRVKTLEAEMERMKKDHDHLMQIEVNAANDGSSEAATAETRAVSRVRLRRDPAAASCAAAGRHISSLGEDLLLDIFLRLPSLATLVRAACTCRAWRHAVASSPAFRRRFRDHHPPPLLGLFFQAYDPAPTPNVPAFPAFVPARPKDLDMAAAIRGGDFFLTSLQGRPDDEPPCWEIMDGSRGYLLLVNSDAKLIAVFNPVTRHSERVFDIVSLDTYGMYPGFTGILLWEDEDSMSFRVVLISQEDRRVQLLVFSSDTGLWLVTPWVEFPARPDGNENHWLPLETSMQANGFQYWVYDDRRYMVSRDIATMEFSVTELPQCLSSSFDIGHTKDGKTCIVYADKFNVGVCLMHASSDGNGVDRWVLDRVVAMDTELQRVLPVQFDDNTELNVLEVWNGYVYLATSTMLHDPIAPCWFMVLCLETMKMEVLFRRMFDNFVNPYIMAWPPSLLGNNDH